MAGRIKPTGRPSSYTEEIGLALCEGISVGRSLPTLCKELGISIASVFRWLTDEKRASFREQYARAREAQADVLAEEILDISDDTEDDPNSRRIRVDARKWYAGKVRPKKYGDASQIDVNMGGQRDNPIELQVKLDPAEAYKRLLGGD
jgi:hypothetical protein